MSLKSSTSAISRSILQSCVSTRPTASRSILQQTRRLAGSTSTTNPLASSAPPPRPIIPAETPRQSIGPSYIPHASPSRATASTTTTSATASADAFSGPSRPRPSPWEAERKSRRARDLPSMRSKVGLYVLAGVAGLGVWGLFIAHATNAERLSSSIMRQITYQLRNDPDVNRVLGERIRYAPNWWGFGEPYISGHIQLPLGRVDLKFRVEGSEGAGTVYFTSIRPGEGREFHIVRYKVNADNGEVINLNPNKTS